MTSTAPVPALVFDFDGTVCVGDAPVWAYAEGVIADVLDSGTPEASVKAEALRERLGAFLDGAPGSPAYLDGYAAVASLATDDVTKRQLNAAFTAARAELAAGRLAVRAPEGLPELLHGFAGRARRILVTNSPAAGMPQTIAHLGLDGCFDELVTDAAKPTGWVNILPRLTADRPISHVLSIGDIWVNDLQPPLEAGATVLLIDRFGHHAGPANATARTMPPLYPALREWVADPESFRAANPPR